MKFLIAGLLAALTGCATGGSGPGSTSAADLTVTAITPVAGSPVQSSTVVQATVDFTIQRFKLKGDTYYLLTQFGDTSGAPIENESDRHVSDHPILTAAKGSVVVTYPLASVWNNPRLQKPLRMWFCVMERIGPNDAVVIGRSPVIEYAAK